MRVRNAYRIRISLLLVLCIITNLFIGCSSKHVEGHYQENVNEDILSWGDNQDNSDDNDMPVVSTWDSADIVSWDSIDEYSDWVYSEIIFDNITDEWPIVECQVFNYRDNGNYFDGEKVYELVNNKFDVNSFIAKYAIGTGVIVILVILNVATAGGTTPICCIIAGAAEGSVTHAIKGAAYGAAMKAVAGAIKSGGDPEETLYAALEGSADGYMWGAMYGAITGGWNSKFCFTEDTLVKTLSGYKVISDIKLGDYVYSYNERTGEFSYQRVSQVTESDTPTLIAININGTNVYSTNNHPYYTADGWKIAKSISPGDRIWSSDYDYKTVLEVNQLNLQIPIPVYSLSVNNNHSFVVSEEELVVHNRCNLNSEYAGKRYHFPEGSPQAKKYPKGVPFTKDGFPDFSEYAKETVKFPYPDAKTLANNTCLKGNCTTDFDMANKACNLLETPPGYTWHHCEDAMTMQLVPQDLHSPRFHGVAHNGGESIIKEIIDTLGGISNG